MVCPFLKYCNKKVNFSFYQNYCRGNPIKCETYQKLSKEERTPKEWKEILEFGSVR